MKKIKVLFILISFVACTKEVNIIKPTCLLSEAEMVELMVDFSLAKSSKSLGRKGLKDMGIKPLEYLFAKHGVDSIVFRENLNYYNNDLKKSNEIYTKATDIVKARQELLQRVIDSLPENKDKDEEEIKDEENEDEEVEKQDSEEETKTKLKIESKPRPNERNLKKKVDSV